MKCTSSFSRFAFVPRMVSAFFAAALLLWAAAAFADDALCVNTVNVPNNLPVIDGNISGDQGYQFANQYAFNNGVSDVDATVQIAKHGNRLYLTFDVRNDPAFSDDDVIIVLIGPDVNDATKDRRIHIYPVTASGGSTTPGTGSANDTALIQAWQNSNNWPTNFGTPSNNPAWIKAKVVATDPAVTPVGYRLEIEIDTAAAGLTFPANATHFKLHFNILRHYEGPHPTLPPPTTKTYIAGQLTWPSGTAIPTSVVSTGTATPNESDVFANPIRSAWGNVTFDRTYFWEPPGGCSGVRVKRVWINNTSNSSVLTKPVSGGTASNTYFVEVENTGTAHAGHVLATLHAARFGTNPLNNFGPVPSAPQPMMSWTSSNTASIAPGATRQLTPSTWTITYQQFQNVFGTGSRTVCSLLQLDVDTAHVPPNVPATLISSRYFYWNTHFAYGSVFRDSAVLDTRGFRKTLDPSGLQHFHLVASTRELPGRSDDRRGDDRAQKRFARMDIKSAEPELGLINAMKDYEKGAAFLSATLCGFRSTGGHIKLRGKTAEVMERMPCYGYWIAHHGQMEGWKYSLSGPGLKAVAPHLYAISIPDGKEARLDTRIESVEKCPCNANDRACFQRCLADDCGCGRDRRCLEKCRAADNCGCDARDARCLEKCRLSRPDR